MLTRDAILTCNDRPLKEVEVPEWNGSVFVRAVSARELLKFVDLLNSEDAEVADLVVLVAVDATGTRIFSDDDVEALGDKSPAALKRIADAFLKFNGFSAEGVEDAKKD